MRCEVGELGRDVEIGGRILEIRGPDSRFKIGASRVFATIRSCDGRQWTDPSLVRKVEVNKSINQQANKPTR